MHHVERLNTMPLGDWLKQARGDMSMRELARRSQLSAAQISRLESGEISTPSVETLTQIANALGRNPEFLLIVAGRIQREDALHIIERALLALPAGTARDLAGAWHALRELESSVASLEDQMSPLLTDVMAEIEKRSPNERSDVLDTEIAELLRELNEQLSPERDRLDGFVRACAGRLFAGPFPSFPRELLYAGMEPAQADGPSQQGPESPTTAYWNVFKHLWRPSPEEGISLSEPSGPSTADTNSMTWSQDPRVLELVRIWLVLTPERRDRVFDFVEDQRRLSLQERANELRNKEVKPT
jgi:transcriptional regulator with XRE-family HTH domain